MNKVLFPRLVPSCCGALLLCLAIDSEVAAVPPPAAAVSSAGVGQARWIEHEVIPGESLQDVVDRYDVDRKDVVEWNALDTKRPRLKAGVLLRIFTARNVPQRERISHVVQRGESWSSIAKDYGVSVRQLRKDWNRDVKGLRAKVEVTLFLDKQPGLADGFAGAGAKTLVSARLSTTALKRDDAAPQFPAPDGSEEGELGGATYYFPIVDVPLRSRSLGHPGSGRILHPVQLPQNDPLYTLRDPERSYASSHTAMVLQNAVARFRLVTEYDGLILVKDLSRRGGGPLYPHKSHQSGRDADVQLLLEEGVSNYASSKVDWEANWALFHELIESGRIRYIFLSWPQQRLLYRAAKRAGMKDDDLAPLLEFPSRGRASIIRDEEGHDTHFHVRVDCAPWEPNCIN